MVVDDEAMVRRFVRYVVNKHLPELEIIGEAANGVEAVQKALEYKPDIFLTDIRMPKMDGLDAARRVIEVLPHTQVVFLTAYEEFDYAKEALNLKAEEYLVKPIRPQNLIEVLQRCISKVQQQGLYATMLVTINSLFAESQGYLRAHFAEELLQGNIDSKRQYFRMASLAGYETIPDLIAVVEIDDDIGDGNPLSCVAEIKTIIEDQQLSNDEKLFVYHQKPGTFVCFLKTNASSEEAAVAMAKMWASKIQMHIKAKTGMSVTIGIGSWVQELTSVPMSYQAANVAKSYRFIKGPGQIWSLLDVNYQESPNVLPLLPCQTQLAEAIQLGNPELVQKTVKKVVTELKTVAKISPPKARQSALDTAQIAVAAAREGAMKKDRVASCLARHQEQLESAASCQQIAEALASLTTCLARSVEKTQTNLSSETVQKAIAFIQDNYHDDLTLSKVAGVVYLSPYYFSRLFKRTTGMNFTRYLTKVRIDAAKQLLKKGDRTVKEIAMEVGYTDPRYFSSVFKKVVGVSPSDYS